MKITGKIVGLYNLIADNPDDTRLLFSDQLSITKKLVDVKLRSADISALVIVHAEKIKKKCDTKIIFIVNRLDEYETHESIQGVLPSLMNLIKIKDRRKKLNKIATNLEGN
jgi:hypothetical protein